MPARMPGALATGPTHAALTVEHTANAASISGFDEIFCASQTFDDSVTDISRKAGQAADVRGSTFRGAGAARASGGGVRTVQADRIPSTNGIGQTYQESI